MEDITQAVLSDCGPGARKEVVMTKEEINKAVAEKVMGWTWLEILGGWDPGSHILNDIKFKRDWNPAERIDHAWMVVEKSNAFFELFNNPIKKIWAAKFQGMNDFVVADTAPMAICLAALEAVKADQPKAKK